MNLSHENLEKLIKYFEILMAIDDGEKDDV
jgi:hypothetical protein